MDWSQEKSVLLIEAYQHYRCLWDPTTPDYKNSILKQDAWQEIAKMLECSVDDTKKKMDSLLASYRRERQKTMTTKSGSGADSTYHSKWFAYKQMNFLLDKYKPRNTLRFDNENKTKGEELETEQYEQRAEVEGRNRGKQSDSLCPQPAVSGQSSIKPTQTQPSNTLRQTSIPPKRFKPADPRVDEAYRILKDTYDSKTKDVSQAFGNHIAFKHRSYSKRTKAFVEKHINNILFEADVGKYSDSSTAEDEQQPNQSPNAVLEDSSQKQTINTSQKLDILDDDNIDEETRKSLVFYFNNFK